MANVVDVVTELSYNADVTPIEHVNAAFGEQQKLIQVLMRENLALEQQKKRLSDAGITNQTKINALIEQNTKRINEATAAMGKQLVTSEKLQTSVKRSKQQFDSLSFSFGNLLRDAPYGFIGIANNIGPAFDDLQRKLKSLQAEGKPTTAIFSSIGASLFGFTGLVNLAVLGISLLGNSMGGVTAATADLTNAQEANIAVSGEAAKLYAKEAAELGLLADEVSNSATSQERLLEIRKELIKDYPELASSLEGEENLQSKLYNAIINVTEALKQQAIAKAALNLITKETERFLANEISDFDAFGIAVRNSFTSAFSGTGDFLAGAAADAAKLNQKQYESTVNNLTSIYKKAQVALDSSGLGKILPNNEKAKKSVKETGKTLEELRKEIDELARSVNRLDNGHFEKWADELEKAAKEKLSVVIESLQQLKDNFTALEQQQFGSQLTTDQSSSLNKGIEDEQKKRKDLDNQKKRNEDQKAQDRAELNRAKDNLEKYREIYKKQRELDPNSYDTKTAKEDFKNARQKYRELRYIANAETRATIDAAAEGYKTLASTVGDVLNQIYDRQLAGLDRQISATQERISLAVELAKAGNGTILKEEEDRLDSLNKKREEIADKQLRTNAALQASASAIAAAQAIQTVTNAGATGDPYTTAARIAAAVAALAAGFAFVSSLTEAFADGVVDYQGKGNGRSDSNIVRISKGESVITAEATQRYKPMLAAMNAGTFTAMPMSTQGVSRMEMDGVHSRLDQLIEVVGESSTVVNNRMDERGWLSMTERTRRRDQNRFR